MNKIITLSICLITLVTYSQQTPQRNLYGFNKYAINPAYAGASGCTQINFSHLNQWVKVDGAPLTSMISANGLLSEKIGIGGQILVDQIGMIQQVSAMGSASYGITIAETHKIRLGASFGYNQYRIDASNAIALIAAIRLLKVVNKQEEPLIQILDFYTNGKTLKLVWVLNN